MLVRRTACFVALALLAAVGCQAAPSAATHQLSAEEQEALRVVNQLRTFNKQPPISQDVPLSFVARAHAQETAAAGGEPKPPPEWLEKELAAVGHSGAVEIVTLEMDRLRVKNAVEEFFTPVRRYKYFKPEYQVCGVGVAQFEGRGKFYMTLFFAAQPSKAK